MKEIKTKEELTTELQGNVVVKIGMPSCGPCRIVEQTLGELEKEREDVKFLVVDADSCDEDLLDHFGVRGVPVVIYYSGANELERTVGLQTKEQILKKLEEHYVG